MHSPVVNSQTHTYRLEARKQKIWFSSSTHHLLDHCTRWCFVLLVPNFIWRLPRARQMINHMGISYEEMIIKKKHIARFGKAASQAHSTSLSRLWWETTTNTLQQYERNIFVVYTIESLGLYRCASVLRIYLRINIRTLCALIWLQSASRINSKPNATHTLPKRS